jgi:hypothetical protein
MDMFASMDYNPHLSQVPGASGLKFFCTADVRLSLWPVIQKTIIRLNSGYVGEYAFITAPSLTKEE